MNTRVILSFLILLFSANVSAGLFGSVSIDEFCKYKSYRTSILYIDSGSVSIEETDWATEVQKKLIGNLMPSERLDIVLLSDAGSTTVWSACYPDYTPDQKKKFDNETFILTEHPLKTLKKQQQLFSAQFVNELNKAFKSAIDIGSNSESSLSNKIIMDSNRFSKYSNQKRVIIYSNLKEANLNKDSFEHVNFDGAIFYFLSSEKVIDNKERLKLIDIFRLSGGILASYSKSLPISNIVPKEALSYEVHIELADRPYAGWMRLLIDRNGILQDSSIYLSGVTATMIEGTFSCRSDKDCRIDAKTITSFILQDSNTEEVVLAGNINSMEGYVGIKNADIYGASGKSATLKFSIVKK